MTRIHITGGPGSGKTRLANLLATRLGLELLELDGQALSHVALLDGAIDHPALIEARRAEAFAFATKEAWISEGSNIAVAQPLLERAEVVVVLYCPWHVASYRILTRHAKASIARNNRFPGLRRLYRFWRWSRRYYANTNPDGLNEWGTPNTGLALETELRPYSAKLTRCRSPRDIRAFVQSLLIDQRPAESSPSD